MAVLLQTTLVLVFAALAAAQSSGVNLGPTYTLQNTININNFADRQATNFSRDRTTIRSTFSDVEYYEWEGYDGWFNNPAHPEWGGAGKPLIVEQVQSRSRRSAEQSYYSRM